jgi:hypothetical protein
VAAAAEAGDDLREPKRNIKTVPAWWIVAQVPGIGAARDGRIIEMRKGRPPFRSWAELAKVPFLGRGTGRLPSAGARPWGLPSHLTSPR